MRRRVSALARAAALAAVVTVPYLAAAQQGPVDPNAPLPPGHPGMGMPSVDPDAPLQPVDPDAPLPPGHPGTAGAAPSENVPHAVPMPGTLAEESPLVPPGTILVRVVDPVGNPVAGASVRVGSMREGERGEARTIATEADGMARIDGLATDGTTAYRVSTDNDGARFGALPFQLSAGQGYKVQLVRFDVDHGGRGTLIWDARVELHFRDDRLVVVERMQVVNLTGMALGAEPARPLAYVPTDGLRFGLPVGYTAFNVNPSMNDVRLTDENGAAVLRGSIPPTGQEPIEVTFQYHIKLDGTAVDFSPTLPLPVVSATVISEAPPGLTLAVDGMPAAEARESRGQHVLLTGMERRPVDSPLRSIHVHLGGIPSPAGPARWMATLVASALVAGGLAALLRGGRGTASRSRAVLAVERARVLAEAGDLARAHQAGDVGPLTYERRRRELTLWLASVLKAEEAAGVRT